MVFGEAKVKPESLMGIAGNVIAVVVFVVVVVLVEATDAGQDTTLGVASMSASATGASAVGAGSAALVTVIGAVVATASETGAGGGCTGGDGWGLGGSVFLASSVSVAFDCIVGTEGRIS